MSSELKSIAVNSAFLSSARAVTSIVRAFYGLALARFLGNELYGLFNYGLSWYIIFIPICTLGLDAILTREIALNPPNASTVSGKIFVLRSFSGLFFSILSLLLIFIFETEPQIQFLLVIFTIALFGRGMSLWCNTIFRAHEKSYYVFILEIIFRSSEIVLGLILLFNGSGIHALAAAHSSLWLLQFFVGLVLVNRHTSKIILSFSLRTTRIYLRQGLPFILAAFLSSWFLQGPVLIFRHVNGVGSDLGQLTLSLQSFFILATILNEIAGAALPVLSRSAARGGDGIGRFIKTIILGGMVLGALLTITSVGIGRDVFLFIFGSQYEDAAMLLPYAMSLVIPYFWTVTMNTTLVAEGHYWTIPAIEGSRAAVLTILFPIFAAKFNLMGVFASLSVAIAATLVIQFVLLGFRGIHFPFMRMGKFLVAELLGLAAVVGLIGPLNTWLSTVIGILSFCLIALLIKAIRIEEIQHIFGK